MKTEYNQDNKGKFGKGNKGKPKGAVTKVSMDARALFTQIMEGQVEHIEAALNEIYKKDKYKYIDCLAKLMPYFMSKKIDTTTNGESINITPIIQILPSNADDKI